MTGGGDDEQHEAPCRSPRVSPRDLRSSNDRDGRILITRPPRPSAVADVGEAAPVTLVQPHSLLAADVYARGPEAGAAGVRRSHGPGGGPVLQPPAQPPLAGDAWAPLERELAAPASVQRAEFASVLWQDLFAVHVAPFLTLEDVLAVGEACRAARRAAQRPALWRRLASERFSIVCRGVDEVCGAYASPAPRAVVSPVARAPSAPAFLFSACDAQDGATAERSAGESLSPSASPLLAAAAEPSLAQLDSQAPSPTEHEDSQPGEAAAAHDPMCCSGSYDEPCHIAACASALTVPPQRSGSCGEPCLLADDAAAPPSPVPSAPALSAFPWRPYVLFLQRSSIGNFLCALRRHERSEASVALLDGEGDDADDPSLLGRLTHNIHALCQDPPPPLQRPRGAACAPVEQLAYLAHCLQRRGWLLCMSAEVDEVGSAAALHTRRLALEDLAAAEVLRPDDRALRVRVEALLQQILAHPPAEDSDELAPAGYAAAPAPSASCQPHAEHWLERLDAAANVPRPLARAAVLREWLYSVEQRAAMGCDGAADGSPSTSCDALRSEELLVHLHGYLFALSALRTVCTHFLVRAAAVAATASERLLVQALRLLGAGSDSAAAGQAAECAELAISLLKWQQRVAVEEAARSWLGHWAGGRLCDAEPAVECGCVPVLYATVAIARAVEADAASAVPNGFFDACWWWRPTVMQSCYPPREPAGTRAAAARAASHAALLRFVAVTRSRCYRAAALTGLAAGCLQAPREDEDEDASEDECLSALMPHELFTRRQPASRAAAAQRLLLEAVRASPLSVAAHVWLARLSESTADASESDGAETTERGGDGAYAVLSRCVHRYAVRYPPPVGALFSPATEASLRRRERSAACCFMPAALLAERSRVPSPAAGLSRRRLADAHEAARCDRRLSFPSRVKAAVALDAAARLLRDGEGEDDGAAAGARRAAGALTAAADAEMRTVTSLAIAAPDVALCVRFLQDSARTQQPRDGEAAAPTAETMTARRWGCALARERIGRLAALLLVLRAGGADTPGLDAPLAASDGVDGGVCERTATAVASALQPHPCLRDDLVLGVASLLERLKSGTDLHAR